MFNSFVDTTIDQVVVAKKSVIDVTSPTKEVKKIFNDFVDAQAKYTRDAFKAGTDVFTKLGEVAMDRTPYVEAAKTFSSFFPTAQAASKKAK